MSTPSGMDRNEYYDRQAAEVLKQVLSPRSNCIDIGCCEGLYLKLFLKYSPNAQHYAFEPILYYANKLRQAFPNVQVFNLALSDKSGEAPFYVVPSNPGLSSLSSRPLIDPDAVREEVKIRTERLDSIIPPQEKIDLIKIDVEGAEGFVFSGGMDTIRRNKPFIIFEHGGLSSEAFGIMSEEIYDILVEQCGLRISLMKDWMCKKPSMTKKTFIESRNDYFLAYPRE
ncbi:FkbM family methyltransferase [candidate division CSSED10-310 bacterium]|uniref:FkbM family methyltransferase n=1 Tax=candidate division CSSED10-310 bacterium TaxID=2855610 RepID=A0ABV6YQT0_UNCC1